MFPQETYSRQADNVSSRNSQKYEAMYLARMEGDPVFGALLRSIREARKETLVQAAVAIGCSRSHLNNIELGEKRAGRDLLFRISRAYGLSGLSLDDFIAASEGKPIKGSAKLDALEAAVVESMRTWPEEEKRDFARYVLSRTKPKNKRN